MERRIIPLRALDEHEIPIFHKHVCPPTFSGDAIDAVTPTRRIARILAVNRDLELRDGTRIPMWLFEDPEDSTESSTTFPAKTIKTVEGDIVHARVGARLNTHTVHWHGIEPTPMNDGVGKHSFEIAGNFVYQFATNQAGTFLYHCHKNTALHFEMGLYGAFIVHCKKPNTPEAEGVPNPPYPDGGPGFIYAYNPPTNKIKYDVDVLWVPDDIDTRWHQLGHNAFMPKCNEDDPTAAENFTQDGILNDFRPDVFVLSGEAKRKDDDSPFEKAAIRARVGQTVLLRFIGATYTVNELRFGLPITLVAEDGYPFGVLPRTRYSRPVEYEAGQPIRITAAMRGDALIRPDRPGRFPCTIDYFHWVTGKKLYTATTFIEVSPA